MEGGKLLVPGKYRMRNLLNASGSTGHGSVGLNPVFCQRTGHSRRESARCEGRSSRRWRMGVGWGGRKKTRNLVRSEGAGVAWLSGLLDLGLG